MREGHLTPLSNKEYTFLKSLSKRIKLTKNMLKYISMKTLLSKVKYVSEDMFKAIFLYFSIFLEKCFLKTGKKICIHYLRFFSSF